MIGRQEGVGSPTWGRYHVASGIDHEIFNSIPRADTTYIPDVMAQCSEHGVAPITGGDDPLDTTATQNVLYTKGHQCRVFTIVIKSIAASDTLYDKPGGFVQTGGDLRLLVSIDSAIGLGEVPSQRISQEARGV